MHDKRILVTCLHTFLLLAAICAFFSLVHVCYATVINVPQDYPKIQQAINAASPGDTINVSRRSGESQSVYNERLTVDKELTIVGESRETIIIDAGGIGTVVRITAHNVEIRGFTVRNGGNKYSGIRTNGYSYVTIANNTLEANKNGIALLYSNYNTVVQNLLSNNYEAGISLSDSIGNNVSDNEVSESAYSIKLAYVSATFVVGNTVSDGSYGIYLQSSSNDTVDRNTLTWNGVSGILPYECQDIIIRNNYIMRSAYGIQIHTSDTITVLGNNVTDNSYSIYLAHSTPSNTIENNTISDSDWAIKLYNSSSNTLKGNTISCNTYGVDLETESNNNLIYHNNFICNIEQAAWNPYCLNTWDDGYPSGGNYWSDYEERYPNAAEIDGSGIWDTAYVIDPMNKDRYPLMAEWGGIHDVAILNVIPSATEVLWGELVSIDVDVKNEGTWSETFDVTVKYNSTVIGVQTVNDLSADTNTTLTFSWNTTDADEGNYTIEAEATVVVFETDTADNTYIDGTVTVIKIHDVAVTGMKAWPLWAPQGQNIYINVTVENLGTFSETFYVIVYTDNAHIDIGNETASLDIGASTTLEFTWNTTDVPCGTYYVTAEAVLPEDGDPANNFASVTVGGICVPIHEAGTNVFGLFAPLASAILVVAALGAVAIVFFRLLMLIKFDVGENYLARMPYSYGEV